MSGGKHVMLSYQWDSQAIVTDVYKCLQARGIPLWMDTQGGMKGHLSTSMAEGVENAAVLCCFLTPQYQDSVACKDELTYAKERHVSIIPIRLMKDWKPTGWLGFSITGLKYINFCDITTNMDLKINQLIAEIQMVAGDKLGSIQGLNSSEKKSKPIEGASAVADQGIEIGNEHFNPNFYYRLTTQWQGDNKSLDVANDGKNNNQLILAETGNYSGQHWKITLVENGYYRLTTEWQGDDKCLAFIKDGQSNCQFILAESGADSSQFWRITSLKNKHYRLTSKREGQNKSLDIISDGKNDKITVTETGDCSGQFWKITKV